MSILISKIKVFFYYLIYLKRKNLNFKIKKIKLSNRILKTLKFLKFFFNSEPKVMWIIITTILSKYIYRINVFYNARIKKYVDISIYYISRYLTIPANQILFLPIILIIISFYLIDSDLNSVLFAWFVIQTFIYLLYSGFIYLLNRNNYANNLSQLSRFWKRSFMIFWLLEAFLFACFSFLLLNEGQDLWVAKDSVKLFKSQQFLVAPFLFRLSILCMSIVFLYGLLLSIESNFLINKPNKFISFILIFTLLLEVYFTIILSQSILNFSYDSNLIKSKLNFEYRRIRIFNQYIIICSLAKFWHFVLVFFSWYIIVPSTFPKKNNQHGAISFILQNLVAIYFLTLLMTIPYIKYLYHNNLEIFSNFWSFLKINDLSYIFFDIILSFYL